MKTLTDNEIRQRLLALSKWKVAGKVLSREYRFSNFPTAVVFMNNIVNPIEELAQYPSISITYNRVVIAIKDPTVKGFTQRDFDLAEQIESLAGQAAQN